MKLSPLTRAALIHFAALWAILLSVLAIAKVTGYTQSTPQIPPDRPLITDFNQHR